MRELNNMTPLNREHLYNTHVVDVASVEDSQFGWCLDTVMAYRAPREDDKLDGPVVKSLHDLQADDQAIEDWLHAEGDDEEMPFSAPDPDITPEQRAIQWAVTRGGAQNL
jgi:hypothetical protein